MKAAVVSYSLTGNNAALAASIAEAFGLEHIRVSEPRARSMGTTLADIFLGRTPRVEPPADIVGKYEIIVFVGPVWMGKAATPLRAYLKRLRAEPRSYAFVSISGGAMNDNPKLAADLAKWAGAAPVLLSDQHIAGLLPADPKPTTKDTSAYKLSAEDVKKLAVTAVDELNGVLGDV